MARQRTAPEPIPLTVLTGFLGAGKTTILNGLLRDPALADTVVIVNEFGEIGLDHLLIETVEDGMVLLAAGCICCTVRGDLVARLEDLLRRRDNDRMAPFRRVVIETTGLADPVPVLASVLYHPYLSRRFALGGVVTAVDALNGLSTLERYAEAVRQVAVADRIVVTKSDLAGASDHVRALEARLRDLNGVAPIRRVVSGAIAASDVLADDPFGLDGKSAEIGVWLEAEEGAGNGHGHAHHHDAHPHDAHPHDAHHHDTRDHDTRDHDTSRHDERIRSVSLTAERPIAESALDMFLGLARDSFGPKILRLKGILDLVGSPGRPVVIQGVQHVVHVPAMLPAWPSDDRRSRLVMIVEDVPTDAIVRLWDAVTGRPAIDRPDGTALADNPLAPATLAR